MGKNFWENGDIHCTGTRIGLLLQELKGDAKKQYDEGLVNNAFNQYASDMISVHRTLPTGIDEE
jgi:hypothetical protein